MKRRCTMASKKSRSNSVKVVLKRLNGVRLKNDFLFLKAFSAIFIVWLILYGFIGLNNLSEGTVCYSLGKISEWFFPSVAVSFYTVFLFSWLPSYYLERNIINSCYRIVESFNDNNDFQLNTYGLFQIIDNYSKLIHSFIGDDYLILPEHSDTAYKKIYDLDINSPDLQQVLENHVNNDTNESNAKSCDYLIKIINETLEQCSVLRDIAIFHLLRNIRINCKNLSDYFKHYCPQDSSYYKINKTNIIYAHEYYKLLYDWIWFYKGFDIQRNNFQKKLP